MNEGSADLQGIMEMDGVDGNIRTNGIESAFSLFKRAVIGNYHRISTKHFHRYLSGFETRIKARKAD